MYYAFSSRGLRLPLYIIFKVWWLVSSRTLWDSFLIFVKRGTEMRFVATVCFGKKIRSCKLFDKSYVWRGHRLQGKCKTGQSCVSTGGPFVWPLLAISTHLHWSIDPHYIPLLCTAPLNPFRDMALFFTQRRLKIALKSGQETVMASYVLCPPWWDTLLVWMYL